MYCPSRPLRPLRQPAPGTPTRRVNGECMGRAGADKMPMNPADSLSLALTLALALARNRNRNRNRNRAQTPAVFAFDKSWISMGCACCPRISCCFLWKPAVEASTLAKGKRTYRKTGTQETSSAGLLSLKSFMSLNESVCGRSRPVAPGFRAKGYLCYNAL